jgi:acetoin utilization deacetylase AcuC-like enzyme
VLRQFRPELILISAGFDALADDPLGGMRLSANQFARLTATICGIADESCSGRVVAITEGGYDLAGFAGCLRAVIPVLNGETSLADHVAPLPAEAQTAVAGRGHSTIDAVVPGLRQFWQL